MRSNLSPKHQWPLSWLGSLNGVKHVNFGGHSASNFRLPHLKKMILDTSGDPHREVTPTQEASYEEWCTTVMQVIYKQLQNHMELDDRPFT